MLTKLGFAVVFLASRTQEEKTTKLTKRVGILGNRRRLRLCTAGVVAFPFSVKKSRLGSFHHRSMLARLDPGSLVISLGGHW